MRRAIMIAGLAPMLALGACAGAGVNAGHPVAPGVVAVPSNGKQLPVFQQEDEACRVYAAQQVAGPPLPNNGYTPGTTLQQRYDIAYTQCMYSKGNTVLSASRLTGRVQLAENEYATYPYYGVLFGSSVLIGSGSHGRGGHGFHHGSGVSRGGWAGGHGWTGGRGWGGGRGSGGGHGSAVAHGGSPSGGGHGSGRG